MEQIRHRFCVNLCVFVYYLYGPFYLGHLVVLHFISFGLVTFVTFSVGMLTLNAGQVIIVNSVVYFLFVFNFICVITGQQRLVIAESVL